jgi:hypothetical protein
MPYTPLIKKRGFFPNEIAVNGIPDYANSTLNHTIVGTMAHEEWWKEQLHRILNGYTTGGVFIPGRYYYYLNFILISTVGRGLHHPEFVDIDLEYFNFIEQAKKDNKGIICIKARRKGMSEKSKSILDYGIRFSNSGYKAGICAGQETYSEELFDKVKKVNKDLPKELQMHYLKDNAKELVCGYTEMTNTGEVSRGSLNTVICETMYNNPDIFKGNAFNDVIFEEAGQFDHLIAGYNATKACFMVGTKMVGTPYLYGTGGDIKSSSHDFRDMWLEADNYGLMKFEIMGPRMMVGYFGGSKNEKGKLEEHIPNIKKLKDSNNNISGCEDIHEAEKVIMETRRELVKGRNKKKYYDYLQNYPLTDKEAFLTFSSNNFDSTILSNQGYAIDSSPTTPYLKYILEWEKNDDGSIKTPFKVKAKIADELEPEDNIIFIRPGYTPVLGYKNLYCSGLDSYDQDSSQTSKSLGSMVVLIREHMIPGLDSMSPIAMIRNRPKHKEIFYENCLKLSIYYNLIGNTLVDIAKAAVIQYYKDKGCQKYLAPRPTSFESENSQQTHEFGVALTGLSKPRMVSLLQTFVAYNGHKIWFKYLIDDLLNYDQLQKDSDWDAADALGIALMRHTDINKKPINLQQEISQDPYDLTTYSREGGHLRPIVSKEKLSEIKDPFLRLIAQGKIT